MISDFNATEPNVSEKELNVINLIKWSNSFKNQDNLKSIDLVMANKSFVMEKGVSDFHQMTHCIPSHLPKLGPTIIKYKDHMSS